jgi:hypothetical protein
MPDFILLMHGDSTGENESSWEPYLAKLRKSGHLQGGSAIGGGLSARKSGRARAVNAQLTGFMRVRASSLEDARTLLPGNPVFEAGGTIEIRELPKTG